MEVINIMRIITITSGRREMSTVFLTFEEEIIIFNNLHKKAERPDYLKLFNYNHQNSILHSSNMIVLLHKEGHIISFSWVKLSEKNLNSSKKSINLRNFGRRLDKIMFFLHRKHN